MQGKKGKRSFTKVQQNGCLDMKSSVKELFEILTVLHSGKKKKKEVSFENEATLQVKVGGLLCVCHTLLAA